ncbi:hypothetical protein [Lacinutrix undariae]
MKKNHIIILFFIPLLVIQTGCSSAKSSLEVKEDYQIYIPTRQVRNNHPIGKLDLYVGARNFFTIMPVNESLKLDISIKNGIIEKATDSGNFYNIYTKNFKRSYLLIKYEDKLDTITFFKKEIPPPILKYQGYSIDTLSSKKLKDFRGFIATLDFKYDCIFEVLSMDILKVNENKGSESFENIQNRSPLMKRIMKQAKPNESYIFHNIKIGVKDTDNIIIRGEDIVSIIVE